MQLPVNATIIQFPAVLVWKIVRIHVCHNSFFWTQTIGMLKQVLQWASEHWNEGIYCIWLGPGHPYLLTFKPELAEVCVCICLSDVFFFVCVCVKKYKFVSLFRPPLSFLHTQYLLSWSLTAQCMLSCANTGMRFYICIWTPGKNYIYEHHRTPECQTLNANNIVNIIFTLYWRLMRVL